MMMSAQNENIIMTIAEPVVDNTPVVEGALLITEEQILDNNYENDDEAEFYRDFIDTINYFESFLDVRIEDFLCPDEAIGGELPYIKFINDLHKLQQSKFAKRTWARMERRTAGEEQVRQKFTEVDKINDPAFKKCPKCPARVKNLKRHTGNGICRKVMTGQILRPAEPDKKRVDDLMYAATLDLNDVVYRQHLCKKANLANIESDELVAEIIDDSDEEEETKEEPNNKVYVIKTFEYNHTTKNIDYAGLWEESETGNKQFKTLAEAREQFEYATEGDKGYIAVELLEIDPDSEVRENVIDEWEDNISDYVESETEDED